MQQVSDSTSITCVIYPLRDGLYTADVYLDGYSDQYEPDQWFVNCSKSELVKLLSLIYPYAAIEKGVTGICQECGKSFYELENVCDKCNGVIDDLSV